MFLIFLPGDEEINDDEEVKRKKFARPFVTKNIVVFDCYRHACTIEALREALHRQRNSAVGDTRLVSVAVCVHSGNSNGKQLPFPVEPFSQ